MRTPRQPDVKTADVALANLAKFFRTANREQAQKAWDVLTGLRGPDGLSHGRKSSITSIIRAKFFTLGCKLNTSDLLGRMCAKVDATVGEDCPLKAEAREREYDEQGFDHFARHGIAAFRALGLSWDKENKF